jgi:CysZ protein
LINKIGEATGIIYHFRIIAFIRNNPDLLRYLIKPVMINLLIAIVLYGVIFFIGWEFYQKLLHHFLSFELPKWLSFIEEGLIFLLSLIITIGLFLFIGFAILEFGTIFGAPWYSRLSEQVEKYQTGKLKIVEIGFFQDIWRAVQFEIQKLLILGAVGLPLLLLNFLPVIGTVIFTIGWFILTTTIICLDFFDPPLERRRMFFKKKLKLVFQSLPASAGFGIISWLLVSVPLFNLITIPICVASGTLFFCNHILPKLHEGNSFA